MGSAASGLSIAGDNQQVALFASVPLTSEPWLRLLKANWSRPVTVSSLRGNWPMKPGWSPTPFLTLSPVGWTRLPTETGAPKPQMTNTGANSPPGVANIRGLPRYGHAP